MDARDERERVLLEESEALRIRLLAVAGQIEMFVDALRAEVEGSREGTQ